MTQTFFFYDLETSGLNAREDRVMQFAGQRTDHDLNPIGEPINLLVKLNDDILPSPEAIMVTAITPQMTQMDGLTEAEFARYIYEEVFTPDTIAVGYNNIRFDDEFVRHLFWRNFFDPYEWTWKDGRSRWDLLDVVRVTRALRPEGIEWPVTEEGKPTNRLELLTKANGIEHTSAHDALSDVTALIAVTKMIQNAQPQLYSYLLKIRDKREVQKLVNLDTKQPFVYVSGRYNAEYNKATVAFPLTAAPHGNVITYDLRYDPTPFLELSIEALRDRMTAPWEQRKKDEFVAVPVKQLQYNRCPAVAPLGVLEQSEGWKMIGLSVAEIERHKKLLLARPDFAEKIRTILEERTYESTTNTPEGALYDGFITDAKDKIRIELVRNAETNQLADLHPDFNDARLPELLLHYKARSYPQSLSEDEQATWDKWRSDQLTAKLPKYVSSLKRLAKKTQSEESFLLEELQLWAESIIPFND